MSCCATTVPMLDALCHPANENSTLKYEQQDQDDDDELYPDDDGHSFASARSSPLDPQDDYLRNVFETFDENKDGSISQEEMKRTLNKLGLTVDDHELAHMIEAADTNSDGFVDFEEFCILYQSLCGSGGSANPVGNGDVSACNNTTSNDDKDSAAVEQEEADMREAFEVFDQNGDGFITSKELQTVLSSLGLKQGRRLADCEKMIRRVDSDGDGRVSFEEFKQMMALGFS